MSTRVGREIKLVSAGMRRMLYAASVLVLIAGIQTYVLSSDTEDFFAWTIGIPLTAAFLGAGYLASMVLEFVVARERAWANARSTVPAVWTFTTLTLIATLLHYDAFHMDTGRGWAWLAVYAIVPVVMGVLLLAQVRENGSEPKRISSLPGWFLILHIGQGLVMGIVGIGLFLTPEPFDGLWAWPLTPLTSRAVGAWLIGLAIVVGQVAMENDWRRARAPMIGYFTWAVLILVALLRYPDTPDWGSVQAWTLVAFVVGFAAVSGYGVIRAGLPGRDLDVV